ncbi:MAG: MotA/TolQ/ExbB proton channel family protein [Planctomycetes bacterium]|nr:MotA/TolQ/ExbB proton channel family protein [Planctomycetota bacterium]
MKKLLSAWSRRNRHVFTCGLVGTCVMVVLVPPLAMATTPNQTAGGTGAGAGDLSFARAFFFSEGSMLGTAIIWFLLALSAVSLGLIGYMWLSNRRASILPETVIEEVGRLTERKEYRTLLHLVQTEPSYYSQVLHASLNEASHGFAAMLRALQQAAEEFTARRLRQIELLNVIGNVAPMIGLFGTVYGMILAFRGIVNAGGRPDPVDLAAGIGTALTTTFWGLVVAIPSLSAHALIRNNIDALTSEAVLEAEDSLNKFRPLLASAGASGHQQQKKQSPTASATTAAAGDPARATATPKKKA